MGIFVNTNVASLNAQRNLLQSGNKLGQSFQRLSSGLRINSAKDDAAGLAITNRFTSQIRGLNQAVRNTNDGISLAQTAEGALQETTVILQRMRELSVQSANDTNTASDRESIQEEVNQLISELDRIATTTNFNTQNILDGTFNKGKFHVGANSRETITVTTVDARSARLGRQSRNDGVAISSGAFVDNDIAINSVSVRATEAPTTPSPRRSRRAPRSRRPKRSTTSPSSRTSRRSSTSRRSPVARSRRRCWTRRTTSPSTVRP